MTKPDDIRLVFIGSAHQAIHYATGHLPEPAPRPDQILAVSEPGDLAGLTLPHYCHIGTELHTTRAGGVQRTAPALEGHAAVFEAALVRRQRIDRAGA
jgi:hypothetical protein